jgi:hypothetical protein
MTAPPLDNTMRQAFVGTDNGRGVESADADSR